MNGPYDQVLIMSYRVGDPRALIVAGASKTKCHTCEHDVLISPSSVKIQEKMKAVVVCDVCYKARAPEIVDVIPLNNDQIEDIQDAVWNKKNRN